MGILEKSERIVEGVEVNQSLNWGRDIIKEWCAESAAKYDGGIRILDLGCSDGVDLINAKEAIRSKKVGMFGIECYRAYAKATRDHGIDVIQLDIERQSIPLKDNSVDIVIINQVMEHVKEIFWIIGEISRVLKEGGTLIVGVPNLASLHNRILLLLGQQPTAIEVLGPHVRGFTMPAFKRFIEADGYFKVRKVRGSNFYPFPSWVSKPLSKLLPTFSVGLFFLVEKIKQGDFVHILDTRPYETLYKQ
jgi:ubiquinone/menaquinone biosynthesis C-methylase UbiE